MEIIPNEGLPKMAIAGPATIKVVPGIIYAWCTCGLSGTEPFCDSTHKRIEPIENEQGEKVLPFRSLKIEFQEEKEVRFCQCKQTKTPPFCDDSHKKLIAVSH